MKIIFQVWVDYLPEDERLSQYKTYDSALTVRTAQAIHNKLTSMGFSKIAERFDADNDYLIFRYE